MMNIQNNSEDWVSKINATKSSNVFDELLELKSTLQSLDASLNSQIDLSSMEKQTKAMRKKYASLLDLEQEKLRANVQRSSSQKKSKLVSSDNTFSPQDVEFMRKESKNLHAKKQQLLDEYRTLETRKHILDAKERIIFQELRSLKDPQVLRVLSFIEHKFSDLAQERTFVAELHAQTTDTTQRLSEKESRLQIMQQEILSRKRNLDAEVVQLQSVVTDLKSQRDSLEEQRLHLDAVVRERSQLISDLDLQFHETKSDLKKIQQQVSSEKKLLGSTRQELEDDSQELESAQKEFERQKKDFYEKISDMSEESKHEVELYKAKVLSELQGQAEELREQEKDLDVKEQMLGKLDSEIHRREIRLSKDLSSLEHERDIVNTRESLPFNAPLTSDVVSLDLQRLMNDLHMAIIEGDSKAAQSLYTTAYALYNTASPAIREKFEMPLKELYYKFN